MTDTNINGNEEPMAIIHRLSNEVLFLRGILAAMGFNVDHLMEPGDDTCKMLLLPHITLDETSLMQSVGEKTNMDGWRSMWAYYRTTAQGM